ncbi:DUF6049 family protein, partial [Ornithinicoccus halotolerans]|uniref:DUF6049 family protein n=1 Tax=Ornithinicoccus halotolerans TaxID=1748220 RepID=UPI001885E380
NRIPFGKVGGAYARASNQDMLTAALAGLRGQWRDATGQDPAAVVVSGGTVDAGHQLTTEASLPAATAPQLQLLSYEPVLSGLLSESSAATGVADRQRLLAELLATYQEQPAARRSLLVVTPREDTSSPDRLAEHARVLHGLPWVRLTSAESLVGSSAPEATAPGVLTGQPAPASAVGDPAALPPVAPSPLLDGGVERVEQVRALLTGAAEVVAGSESAAQRWHEVLDQQYSVRWRGSPAWRQPLEAARAAAERVLAGVHVNPTTVNFLADEGLIQVTVVNDLDLPVEDLQVDVTPRNGRLRVTEPADPVTVGPGSRATVSFRARAVAAGDVPLEVRLTTPGGTEVGEAELMNVHVQPTGTWFYWALGGLAGAVLLLGLVRTLRSPRRGQQDGDEHPKEAPAP